MPPAIDLTGERFGRLIALHRDPISPNPPHVHWVCACDCGAVKSIMRQSLRNGMTRSCGCLANEVKRRERPYGVPVECPCGNVVNRRPSLVRSGRAKFCSVQCRAKFSPLRGADHPAWKGDDVGYDALHDWVKGTLGSTGKCWFCGSTEMVDWANISHEYLRDENDWMELCRKHHSKYDKEQRYARVTHCGNGHEYTIANTIWVNGNRRCRMCASARAFESRKKKVK